MEMTRKDIPGFIFKKLRVSSLYGCKEKLDNVTYVQCNDLNFRQKINEIMFFILK